MKTNLINKTCENISANNLYVILAIISAIAITFAWIYLDNKRLNREHESISGFCSEPYYTAEWCNKFYGLQGKELF